MSTDSAGRNDPTSDGDGVAERLCLRPLEAHLVDLAGRTGFALTDPTGLSDQVLTVSEPVLFILAHFDGTRTRAEVRDAFRARYGQELAEDDLREIVEVARNAHFWGGDEFERYYAECLASYRAAPTRPMRRAADLGLAENTAATLDELLDWAPPSAPPAGTIVGVVAPHLDYSRGQPCYALAYGALRTRPAPKRIIILGTNHFGRSAAIVATRRPFETPLGITPIDTEFLDRLEGACGDLCGHEMDHAREHSIEPQLLLCQHLWGAESFSLVPLLCPDPCGPTGTAPYNGEGPDLAEIGRTIADLLRVDPTDTLVIAGADLSHIGRHFGDDRDLDLDFTREIEQRDRRALDLLAANDPSAFVAAVAEDDNPTRVCSAGCIFAAMQALPGASVHVLGYHQALNPEAEVGVTCCAAAFTR
jgi:AmmeMemoRadiSam system protein B